MRKKSTFLQKSWNFILLLFQAGQSVGVSSVNSLKICPASGPACKFIKKETLSQVFSCEFCEISKNTFLHRTPLVAVSIICHGFPSYVLTSNFLQLYLGGFSEDSKRLFRFDNKKLKILSWTKVIQRKSSPDKGKVQIFVKFLFKWEKNRLFCKSLETLFCYCSRQANQ